MIANCLRCGFSLSAEEARYYGGSCGPCVEQRNDEIEKWRHGTAPAVGIRSLVNSLGNAPEKGRVQ